jgi:hypothetical protein
MFFRIGAIAIAVSITLAGSAQAQVRSPMKLPDPRAEFVRLCAPHMLGRWAHPESVCGCLHDHAAAAVEDRDLREALLRGISETGGAHHRSGMGAAIETIRDRGNVYEDCQADAAMHVRAAELGSLPENRIFGHRGLTPQH